ncbi:hypothetical protein PHLGIDRAFT_298832 [Phlebiopsis gigantea 11061_1 CR5-6]|uniref:Uncharacterized protein n=1 Tax=Phlebiopsis gigantea (strain 11061_1 CR5-6) TaxID=745531 RepID=A0A0C3S3D6_PHLG1|nr:hypothetical protein PHLGIDRAFT_298832 [Phlebiopsis gigantea 11061_1 CR5-6]
MQAAIKAEVASACAFALPIGRRSQLHCCTRDALKARLMVAKGSTHRRPHNRGFTLRPPIPLAASTMIYHGTLVSPASVYSLIWHDILTP